tara:strand:- start:538 stop:768 length:231 start_codon:yes stop_codon:yes gene_type:complete
MAKREEEWLDLIREVLELIVNDKVEAESIRSRIVFRIVLWEYDILQAWTAFMVLTFLTITYLLMFTQILIKNYRTE